MNKTPDFVFNILSYQIILVSRDDTNAQGINVRYQLPTINIFSSSNGDTNQPNGQIFFYPNGFALPVAEHPTPLVINLHFHISMFEYVIKILQSAGLTRCAYKENSNGTLKWAELDGHLQQR